MDDLPHHKRGSIRWRWGLLASLALIILALYPQAHLRLVRGKDWSGSYAYIDTDEVAYSAYLHALINARPRRNDPYAGRDDLSGAPLPESFFSIQFIPAYLVAVPARAFKLSASTAFMALLPLTAVASALAIFWLIAAVTGDSRQAAAGVLVVLCLGAFASAQGAVRALLGSHYSYLSLPFLRRYTPSVAFPVYFAFCALVWRAFTTGDKRKAMIKAALAGLSLALLIYSYFYLWTAAAAWLLCLALLWFAARAGSWRRDLLSVGVIGGCAAAALLPYIILLSHRAAKMDEAQALTLSRAPDLLRPPEIIGILLLDVLALVSRRGVVGWQDRRLLFAASFALTPVVVFNQQILTGRSLQPVHYEQFIANYVVLIGAVLTTALLWQRRAVGAASQVRNGILILTACAAWGWGLVETKFATGQHLAYNLMRDEAMQAARRLVELDKASKQGAHPVVFSTELRVADGLPTVAPQAVLWARHMHVFSGTTPAEGRERFYQQLYYSDFDEEDFLEEVSGGEISYRLALFGWGRANPALAVNHQPITPEEVRAEAERYAKYTGSFNGERAKHPRLSYVITRAGDEPEFTNLDRWYERDRGERLGDYTLYRVRLKAKDQ